MLLEDMKMTFQQFGHAIKYTVDKNDTLKIVLRRMEDLNEDLRVWRAIKSMVVAQLKNNDSV